MQKEPPHPLIADLRQLFQQLRSVGRSEEFDLFFVSVYVHGFELVVGLDKVYDAFDQTDDPADAEEE